MAQKRFVFDDEKETVQTQQSLSQIDQYENYKHSEEKKIIDKKETISKIPKDSFSPQYSMKETREEPIPTMIHKKTKPQQTKLIETSKEEQPRNRSYSKKPRQKVKKKTKKKTKNKTKVIKEKKHRSWFSTLILFFISLCIIAGICVGGYVAYQYYLKQQDQINKISYKTKKKHPLKILQFKTLLKTLKNKSHHKRINQLKRQRQLLKKHPKITEMHLQINPMILIKLLIYK